VVVASDDADENPYTITVSGTGVLAGEIDVQRPAGTSITSGSIDTQGNQTIGADVTLSYTIVNQGNADLAVSGVTVQNLNNVSASVTQTPGSPVAGSGSTTFDVQYTVTAAGAFSFDVVIASNDADENAYTITVNGIGIVNIPTLSGWGLGLLSVLLAGLGILRRRRVGAQL
jgi:hypothetical protein